jgi:hypothetical protein
VTGSTFAIERARYETVKQAQRLALASCRRLQPPPPAPERNVTCPCCGELYVVVWSGEDEGAGACGRDLSDPRERTYTFDPYGPQADWRA